MLKPSKTWIWPPWSERRRSRWRRRVKKMRFVSWWKVIGRVGNDIYYAFLSDMIGGWEVNAITFWAISLVSSSFCRRRPTSRPGIRFGCTWWHYEAGWAPLPSSASPATYCVTFFPCPTSSPLPPGSASWRPPALCWYSRSVRWAHWSPATTSPWILRSWWSAPHSSSWSLSSSAAGTPRVPCGPASQCGWRTWCFLFKSAVLFRTDRISSSGWRSPPWFLWRNRRSLFLSVAVSPLDLPWFPVFWPDSPRFPYRTPSSPSSSTAEFSWSLCSSSSPFTVASSADLGSPVRGWWRCWTFGWYCSWWIRLNRGIGTQFL